MINIHDAIYSLNSSIKTIRGNIAYDQNENQVAYNKLDAETKLAELQSVETAKKEAEVSAKESALSKLTALGLTADEIKALTGTT